MSPARLLGTFWKRFKAWNHLCLTFARGHMSIHGSLIGRYPFLQPLEPLKFGHLYRCEVCGTFWYLPENKYFLNRIPAVWLPLMGVWNKLSLKINCSILDVLASIGGVEDVYRESILIPCAAQDASGIHYEKAIVVVTKAPPIGWPEVKLVRWADELKGITPSPFALPIDVRRASHEKKQESMGFSPVGILDRAGTEYTLRCASDLFDFNGVKGQEIRLSDPRKRWRKVVWPQLAQAYYYIDWFDQCEKVLCGTTAHS